MPVIQRWAELVLAVLLASTRWVQATIHVQAVEQEHSLLPQVLPHTQCVWLVLLARFRQLLGLIQTVPVLSAKLASILKFQGLVLRQVASPVILENTRQLWARRRGLRAWTVAPVHIPSHLGVLQQPVVFNALQAHIQHLLLLEAFPHVRTVRAANFQAVDRLPASNAQKESTRQLGLLHLLLRVERVELVSFQIRQEQEADLSASCAPWAHTACWRAHLPAQHVTQANLLQSMEPRPPTLVKTASLASIQP
jgi:hypothetical protein